jgi:hypothetical protein
MNPDEFVELARDSGLAIWRQVCESAQASFDAAVPDAALALLVGDTHAQNEIEKPCKIIARRAIDALDDQDLLLLVAASWRWLQVKEPHGYNRALTSRGPGAKEQYRDTLRATYEKYLLWILGQRGALRLRAVAGEDVRGEIQRELEDEVSEALTNDERKEP